MTETDYLFGNVRKIVGWLFAAVAGGLLLLSAFMKIGNAVPEKLAKQYEAVHVLAHLRLLGTVELVATILFFWPRTSQFGLVLASAIWGAAIMKDLAVNESFAFPLTMLVMTALAVWLRKPETLMSAFRPTNPPGNQIHL